MIGEYTKRANNHAELLKALKDVNHMIQKVLVCPSRFCCSLLTNEQASRLRMGTHKTQVVELCRKAIKTNNTASLEKIIRLGNVGVTSAALAAAVSSP